MGVAWLDAADRRMDGIGRIGREGHIGQIGGDGTDGVGLADALHAQGEL